MTGSADVDLDLEAFRRWRDEEKKRATRRRGSRRRRWAVLVVLAIAGSAASFRWVRHRRLHTWLEACQSHTGITVNVYYASWISDDAVVFDFIDADGYVRKIDLAHLLLQFAHEIDGSAVDRLILANNSRRIFYLTWNDARELSGEYTYGNPIWSFNHLPERLRTMNGGRAYETWTGGLLAVLKEQAEDLNDFLDRWTGG